MSVCGYFERPTPEGLKGLRQMVEELGGRVERQVTILEQIAEERRAAGALVKREAEPGYVKVEKYDAVLRAHCRID